MKYCLGLDLGVGSIGAAVVELNNDNSAKNIKDAGVRIFNVSEGAVERRAKRTARKNLIHRKKRLTLLAKLLYENGLWVSESPDGTDILKSKCPYTIRRNALYKKLDNQNYIGRAVLHLAKHRGAGYVSEKEDAEEEILDEGEKSKAKKTDYDRMIDYLKESQSLTIGEFFYKRLRDRDNLHLPIRQKESKVLSLQKKENHMSPYAVDYAIPRYLVKDEFNKIWDCQAKYFSQMRTAGLKQKVYDILFYERAAAPYAVGKCIYFHNEDRLLKVHPLSEMRRIYEEVNNIRILSDMQKRRLTKEERDKIINELLLKGKNAGKKSIKTLLNLSGQQKISIPDDEKERPIKAYLYSTPLFADNEYLAHLSQDEMCRFIEFLGNPVNENHLQKRLYTEDELINHLKPLFKSNDEKKIGAILTKIPKKRSMLGISATKIILEKLKESVLSHREVTDILMQTDSHFTAAEEQARMSQGTYQHLPYYGEILQSDTQPLPPFVIQNNSAHLNADEMKWGKIANPAVHMILNQLRRVVNEIIDIYGRPYEIHIELGRDVGLSTKKKAEKDLQQRKNEAANEEAVAFLRNHKIKVNAANILKYKLAKEQAWIDAYDPKNKISQNTFLNFEIEHIIPRAKGGTNTYSNLCLTARQHNLAKKDQFAYQYFENVYRNEPEVIREILKNARKLPDSKSWRFEADAKERYNEQGDEAETTRYLTDTRYVSKLAARYLRAIVDCVDSDEVIHNRILSVKGAQTAELRRRWNLQGLEYDLMGLTDQVPRYLSCAPYWIEQNTGEIKDGYEKPNTDGEWKFCDTIKNKEWFSKPRIDHRHHAIDAITIACITRSLVQKMANEYNLRHFQTPLPLTDISALNDFRNRVLTVLKNIRVSHKPDHNSAGQFHKETGRAVLCENPNDKKSVITVYSRKVLTVLKKPDDLKKLLIGTTIQDNWHPDIGKDRLAQEKLVQDIKAHFDEAHQILTAENEEVSEIGKKEIPVTESRILRKAFQLVQQKGLWKGNSFKMYEILNAFIYIPKHKVAYQSGNNHRVDFYEYNGKIGWEVISRFNANQADFVPEWKKIGAKIIWSVQQGDLLELDTPDEWKQYTDKPKAIARVKKFSEGEIVIDYMSDARMTSPQNKDLKYMFVDSLRRGLSYLTSHHTRKIELTPFGRIKKKHKVLWHGKKTTS